MVPVVLLHVVLPQNFWVFFKKKSASRKCSKAKWYKMRYTCTMECYSALKVKDMCNVDEISGHNALWNKPVTKRQILWFHLVLKFMKRGKEWWLSENRRGENEELLLNGYIVSVLQNESSSGITQWWWLY